MAQFIFTNLFMLALGVILYLFVRALPRVEKEEAVKQGFIERWITSDLPEKVDFAFSNFLVKFLRRSKVWILKIDNLVGNRLKRMSAVHKSEESKPDWSELTGNGNHTEESISETPTETNETENRP